MNAPPIRMLAARAAVAARAMLALSARRKRALLNAVADELEARRDAILVINALDLADARTRGRALGCVERLEITPARFSAMVHAFRTIADLGDPLGEKVSRWIRPNGLEIVRVRVPIGVVGVAFESRPHVIPNAVALCLKAGNSVLFAGDTDVQRTGEALIEAIQAGGVRKGLPADVVQAVFTDDPKTFRDLARLQGLVDVLIPRGGHDFVADLVDYASVPVLKHLGGACHVYVDASADLATAVAVIRDGRCNEPYACNSADTLLVHRAMGPRLLAELVVDGFCRRVRLEPDEEARVWLGADGGELATRDAELSLRVVAVDGVAAAVERINHSGSHLSDAIVAEDEAVAEEFLRDVDSACVLVNASPRLADGGEFGMGTEIGFSTDKLHARGPLGLEALTSTKYLIRGNGQVRG